MDELRDGSVESKLDSEAARILGDFGLIFVTRIVALQLVDLVEFGFCVPFTGRLKKRLLFEDASHFVVPADGSFLRFLARLSSKVKL